MTTLKDPNLPAGAIIEEFEDGGALRNDGVRLKPANNNPWYVLATIAGEQEAGKKYWEFDKELAAENRRYWNGWVCQNLSDEKRAELAKNLGENLDPLSTDELAVVKAKFNEIFGNGKLPSLDEIIYFTETYFMKPIGFMKYVIISSTYFGKAHFADYANFEGAHFAGSANFIEAHFTGYANYGHAHFASSANYGKAHFANSVNYGHTHFTGSAFFNETHFASSANYGHAHFTDSAFFNETHFASGAFFIEAHFIGSARFNSAEFKSTSRFIGVTFWTHVPEFHAAELYNDTVFHTSDSMEDRWPPTTGSMQFQGKGKSVKVMPAEDQKRAYNRLRLFMNKSQQIDEEMFFHRREMACKAEIETGLVRWLFQIYGATSGYGSYVGQPLFGLLAIWFVGMMGMLAQLTQPGIAGHLAAFPAAAGWSFSNLFPFFGFRRLYFDSDFIASLPPHLDGIGAIQTVFGFTFLFLLGLGLRNRFRLR